MHPLSLRRRRVRTLSSLLGGGVGTMAQWHSTFSFCLIQKCKMKEVGSEASKNLEPESTVPLCQRAKGVARPRPPAFE